MKVKPIQPVTIKKRTVKPLTVKEQSIQKNTKGAKDSSQDNYQTNALKKSDHDEEPPLHKRRRL